MYFSNMINVCLLGFGSVNFHLATAFVASKKVMINCIYNRSEIELPETFKNIPFTTKLKEIPESQVYIIGITDDAIQSFSNAIPFKNKLVVHTSGGVSISKLNSKNRKGVFYPLQTFSNSSELDFSKIPICVEAENEEDTALLIKLGSTISENVQKINSNKRETLHLAAVLVNNFTNHLFYIASEITKENNLDFSLLQPLIKETVQKLKTLNPIEAQTGPALRNDNQTIEKHLHLLRDEQQRELYKQLTESIQKTHGKKL
ncbi:Rossmann-like and DUF2520 domain-containing protein [Patiriisocius hiemis]|uniref:DUF2520 domain-containing protein n=1 Tax=Patiriisocius hiemis TaxID=3075604 RepID=A0ABU2Y9Z2_9FLAO|nr:DUF2520 domain-containing protein [Constantimarinum sp. W242]MDT0555003.1 DUF2520 domain-containing protein [Constantimarinum sp. W242]